MGAITPLDFTVMGAITQLDFTTSWEQSHSWILPRHRNKLDFTTSWEQSQLDFAVMGTIS
jgi:hypothetical protein